MPIYKGRKIQVQELSTDFRKATAIVDEVIDTDKLNKNDIVVATSWVGINASDINYTAGLYLKGVKPPFDAGFEGIGSVVWAGEGVKSTGVGASVMFSTFGAFAEYRVFRADRVIPVPAPMPELIPLMVSGLTASIALAENGLKSGETVLVTAAAGATGTFAVQLAKRAGSHVIGTCSSDDKAEMLRGLGCDRVVNYKKESLHQVLKKEYPKGVDLVYESVGGDMFDTCVTHLAVKGRLIVIGFISGYEDASGWGRGDQAGRKPPAPLPARILGKSASIRGFFLNDYASEWPKHSDMLSKLMMSGKLKSTTDPTPFNGLEDVAKAIDHMYQRKNVGKVVVKIDGARSKL